MVVALKERFGKLVQQENENFKERLNHKSLFPITEGQAINSVAVTSYMASPDDTMTVGDATQHRVSTFGRTLALKHEDSNSGMGEDSIEEEELIAMVDINPDNFFRYVNLTDGVVLIKKMMEYLAKEGEEKANPRTQMSKLCHTL